MAKEFGLFIPSHRTEQDFILRKRDDKYFDTTQEITYQDPSGKEWTAPKATITDGASIPGIIAGVFGGRLNEKFLFAAIIHDAYCAEANQEGKVYQTEPWKDTHHMFYHACLANGTNKTTAQTMYAAVRLGGPRWHLEGSKSIGSFEPIDKNVFEKEMDYCKGWIEKQEGSLSIEEIDNWMDEREKGSYGGN